jgi:hypothetical protein
VYKQDSLCISCTEIIRTRIRTRIASHPYKRMDSDEEESLAQLYDVSEDIVLDCEDEGTATGWSILTATDSNIDIDIDGVDLELLQLCRDEVPLLLNSVECRIKRMKELQGNRKLCAATHEEIFDVWFGTTLMEKVVEYINLTLHPAVTSTEVKKFLSVELMLAFYGVSPERYFDEECAQFFPTAGDGMLHLRYRNILKALSTNPSYREDEARTWNEPYHNNKIIGDVLEIMRHRYSEIAFFDRHTRITIDDDLLRMRSRKVTEEGYSQINNPVKGLGVIHHGAVSVGTGIYLGGHIPKRGQSTLDCVKILMRGLCRASLDSDVKFAHGTIVQFDRGYGGPGGVVMDYLQRIGCNLLGTMKRLRSVPITFDQKESPGRMVIQEKGVAAQYWARKQISGGAKVSPKFHYAVAHRNGLKRVALLQTTLNSCGPGKYSYVTQQKKSSRTSLEPLEELDLWETNQVRQITASQRTPEWFILRRFRITATGSLIVWRWFLALHRKNRTLRLPKAVIYILNKLTLLMEDQDDEDTEPEHRNYPYNEQQLAGLARMNLVEICRSKGLALSGTKEVLTQRILGFFGTGQDSISLDMSLLQSWFMAPFKGSEATRAGLMNEGYVVSRLNRFLVRHAPPGMMLLQIREYGLCVEKDRYFAAFSPDGIVARQAQDFDDDDGNELRLGLLEIKTKFTDETSKKEARLRDKFGEYKRINLKSREEDIEFRYCIPDVSHRSQLLHGLGCGHLLEAFYVVATTTHILRVVHVVVDRDFLRTYLRALDFIHSEAKLDWCLEGEIPQIDEKYLGYAADQHSFECCLLFWREMDRVVWERGRPLPPGRLIVPRPVAVWNKCKVSIDSFSRFLSNVKVEHHSLSPIGAMWLRVLMTPVYNSYQTYVRARTEDKLNEFRWMVEYQRANNRVVSFSKFCGMLACELQQNDIANDKEMEEVELRNVNMIGGVKYKKAIQFFTDPGAIAIRAFRPKTHVPIKIGKQMSCIFCCSNHKNRTGVRPPCRFGYRCTKKCNVCGIALCTERRYGTKSCFELFHTATEPFNPCCDEAIAMLHVREAKYRPPPPKRGRVTKEDGSVNSEEEERAKETNGNSSDESEGAIQKSPVRKITRSKSSPVRRLPTRRRNTNVCLL